MFKGLITALFIAIISVAGVSAQAIDDYKKGEFFIGYSNGQVDTGLDSGNSVSSFFRERANFNGVNVSGVYNVSRYIGIKGDASGTFNTTRFSDSFVDTTTGTTYSTSFKTTNSLYNVVGGVQVKDNSRAGTFKPFACWSVLLICVQSSDFVHPVRFARSFRTRSVTTASLASWRWSGYRSARASRSVRSSDYNPTQSAAKRVTIAARRDPFLFRRWEKKERVLAPKGGLVFNASLRREAVTLWSLTENRNASLFRKCGLSSASRSISFHPI